MTTKLAQYRDKLLLFKGTGEMIQVSAGDAREFLLNYSDESYGANQDGGLGITGIPQFDGEIIAEVMDNGCLIIRDASKFKEIIIRGETEFLSVPEFASKYGKSDAFIRRLCQNGRIPGVIQKGNVYLIPANTKYPIT